MPSYVAYQQTPLQTFWPVVLLYVGIVEIFSVFTFENPFGKGGFWQHFSNHQNAHCVLKNERHHRPHCEAASDEKPAGLFVGGACIAGCGRLDVVAKTTTTTRSREKTAWRSSVPRLGGKV